jgi:uncharacterized protein involved in exopolysaccharide biosynthesis
MSESEAENETQKSSMSLHGILGILFKHKWKILIFTLAGLGAAQAARSLMPALYESQAKLLVRYVVDRSTVDTLDANAKTPGPQSENLINSEVEILTSVDLATQVAAALGTDQLVKGSEDKAIENSAARSILLGLTVGAVRGSNIIVVSYKNRDPILAARVLDELVKRYFDKHMEVHRSVGAFEFVGREADRLKVELSQTEERIKELKAKAGIVSLAESNTTLDAELAKGQEELDAAEGELVAQRVRVAEVEKLLTGAETHTNVPHQPSSEIVREYQALVGRVTYLRQVQAEMLSRYTPENRMVKGKQAQIDELEKKRRDLEQKFPGLVGTVAGAASSQGSGLDLVTEKSNLAAIEAKTERLRARLSATQERAKLLAELGPQIAQLQRTEEVQEANYKYYSASLEKARVDETLDPSRMPNISVVQKPSVAIKSTTGIRQKIILGLAGGGLGLGIVVALLIELVLDRTIKRREEIETRLRIPLLLSIPYFGRNGHLALPTNETGQKPLNGVPDGELVPWESGHFIRPFCEAIRDRLIFYFERNRMTHKPKLVAVTSCSEGSGASTVAAGLAATLSETCNGRVLLVDKELDTKRFFDLVNEFKASQFDYVIFDMPALSDTSATLAMAGFVDKVLLVVEAEVSNRDIVKRAYAELVAANANVTTILNKTRTYGPTWLQS